MISQDLHLHAYAYVICIFRSQMCSYVHVIEVVAVMSIVNCG